MAGLQEFCAEVGLDPQAAAARLEHDSGGPDTPWYVRALLAIGAWVTAIAIVAFFLVLMGLVFDDFDGAEFILAGLGLLCFAGGIAMLATVSGGAFRASFATALAAAGSAMAAAGVGLAAESIWFATVTSIGLSAVVIARATGIILQLLVSGLAVALVAVTLITEEVPYFLDVASVFLVAGVVLWCRPPRIDLQATAFALLLMPPILAIVAGLASRLDIIPGGWAARAVHIALFGWLVSVLWRRTVEPRVRMELAAFAAAAVAVCLLLPPGGSAALVILTLAFVLGSWPLALLGTLLQAYFFWRFYYDLQITLLNKSFLLAGVGLVVLACWWLVAGRKSGKAAS